MSKLQSILLILLLISTQTVMKAQDDRMTLGVRAGHNNVFGAFAAFSLETEQTFCEDFSLRGGLQYNTIGRTALEAHPAYNIQFVWGNLSVEALVEYNNLNSINNFSAGAGACVDFKGVSARLGYYYRLYGGMGSRLTEPFNIYYEFRAHFLRKIERWNLDLAILNCEMFELERHYQPTYLLECMYSFGHHSSVLFGIGYKPAGTFNISADYYQSFIKTGICYRW